MPVEPFQAPREQSKGQPVGQDPFGVHMGKEMVATEKRPGKTPHGGHRPTSHPSRSRIGW